MLIQDAHVVSNRQISEGTFLIELEPIEEYPEIFPGQFFNIQVSEGYYPLLRRPFSISNVVDGNIFFMYKVVGEGTKILSNKTLGDKINLLGPLGNSFDLTSCKDHLFILAGGIGIAPFPYVLSQLNPNINYTVLFGVRNKSEIHNYGLDNVSYSSDDGSIGLHGNVIELLDKQIKTHDNENIKVFACGPNAMLRALKKFTEQNNIECDVSMESAMACGFGICQGCPIEYKNEDSYKLICKDGPVFNIKDIEI